MDIMSLQTVDLVAVVASGYLGFKISQLGDQKKHSAEDVLLQSFIFGVLGTAISRTLLIDYSGFILIFERPLPSTPNSILLTAIFVSAIAGALWRRLGQPAVSAIMKTTGIYKGDTHSTVIRSISNNGAAWHYITVHKKDGSVLTSDISATRKHIPLRGVTINDDGLCFYVTSVIRKDGTTEAFRASDGDLSTLTYIPFSEVQQIDVTWK